MQSPLASPDVGYWKSSAKGRLDSHRLHVKLCEIRYSLGRITSPREVAALDSGSVI